MDAVSTVQEALADALVALDTGNAAAAEEAACRAIVAAEHPAQAATAHRVLGDARVLAGDRMGARAALTEALQHTEGLPRRHRVTALVRNSLGVLEKFCGNLDAAAAHYVAALDSVPAEDLEFRAGLAHNLGGLAHSRGDLPAAEVRTREALELHSQLAGPDSAGACADRGQLASIVSGLGRHEEALRLITETVAGFTARYGPDHIEVGIARCTLGAVLDRAGRGEDAEAAYREGLAVREAALGSNHPDLAPTLINLGRVLDRGGDRAGGLACAHRAVDVLAGKVVPEHKFLALARRRVAESH